MNTGTPFKTEPREPGPVLQPPQLSVKQLGGVPAVTIGRDSGTLWSTETTQFEASRAVQEERKHAPRPDKLLSGKGLSFVTRTAKVLAANDPEGKTNHEVLAWLLQHYKQGSTFNSYAPAYEKWEEFCAEREVDPLPANPWLVAEFLQHKAAKANAEGHTASVIDKYCSAIGMASKFTHLENPMSHIIVSMAREACRRLLGYRRHKAYPLLEHHIIKLYEMFAASPNSNIEDVFFLFNIVFCFENCLRFDDSSDSVFGDQIWLRECVKTFLVDTKTDTYKDSQWCVTLASKQQHSAYQLLLRVMNYLQTSPSFAKS